MGEFIDGLEKLLFGEEDNSQLILTVGDTCVRHKVSRLLELRGRTCGFKDPIDGVVRRQLGCPRIFGRMEDLGLICRDAFLELVTTSGLSMPTICLCDVLALEQLCGSRRLSDGTIGSLVTLDTLVNYLRGWLTYDSTSLCCYWERAVFPVIDDKGLEPLTIRVYKMFDQLKARRPFRLSDLKSLRPWDSDEEFDSLTALYRRSVPEINAPLSVWLSILLRHRILKEGSWDEEILELDYLPSFFRQTGPMPLSSQDRLLRARRKRASDMLWLRGVAIEKELASRLRLVGKPDYIKLSSDCRSVLVRGEVIPLTPRQSHVISILADHYESETPEVGHAHIISEVYGDKTKRPLRKLFNNDRAWNLLIVDGRSKGSVQIVARPIRSIEFAMKKA